MSDRRDDRAEREGSELPRGQDQNAAGSVGGTQAGGGPSAADMGAGGGSSGSGGYGNAQNQQFHQGQQQGAGRAPEEGQSRGERFDEAQGGGRGPGSVSRAEEEAFADDQAAHQERGQREAEEETRDR